MRRGTPKAHLKLRADKVRLGANPVSYLEQFPVWKFRDFDWDGPWGYATCEAHITKIRQHIESHLANFETMTWAEILKHPGADLMEITITKYLRIS